MIIVCRDCYKELNIVKRLDSGRDDEFYVEACVCAEDPETIYADGFADGKKAGHEEGYQQGFDEGIAEGEKATEDTALRRAKNRVLDKLIQLHKKALDEINNLD